MFAAKEIVRHWHRLARTVVESPSLAVFRRCVEVALRDMGGVVNMVVVG